MDIHPPEHPIRSVRDFLVQIFTITCGILIALGLEQLIELRHGESLAAHARREFADEIATNRHMIAEVLADEKRLTDGLSAWLDYGEARLAHRAATPPSEKMDARRFLRLSTSAWDTAVATQAVSHMSFTETRALLKITNLEQGLNDMSAVARTQWLDALAGYGDPTTIPDSDLAPGMRNLRIAFAYANSIAYNARALLAQYDAADAELRRGGQ